MRKSDIILKGEALMTFEECRQTALKAYMEAIGAAACIKTDDVKAAIEEAFMEGYEEGYLKGYEEGLHLEKIQIAEHMLENDYQIEFICKMTGLSTTEVIDLK